MSFMIGCSNTSDTPKVQIKTFNNKYQLTREDMHKDFIKNGQSFSFKIGIPLVNMKSSKSEELIGTISINTDYYRDYVKFYARSKDNPKGGNFCKIKIRKKTEEIEAPLTDNLDFIETFDSGPFTLTFKKILSVKPYVVFNFLDGLPTDLNIWFAPDYIDSSSAGGIDGNGEWGTEW
ncbi:hypothetical protein [Campylobacter concisus]|uniref:hypothetical protein n=1 Tax=Campylobacter concisus TaxID=199 RepID=UPI000CD9CDDE|nr:hypothetical protein [Campylobacter concisus]